jgi:hypothetical protein
MLLSFLIWGKIVGMCDFLLMLLVCNSKLCKFQVPVLLQSKINRLGDCQVQWRANLGAICLAAWRKRQYQRNHHKKKRSHRQQDSTRTPESVQEDVEDATEHRSHIERGWKPGGVVKTEAEGAPQVGQPDAEQPAVERGKSRADKDRQDPNVRVGGGCWSQR